MSGEKGWSGLLGQSLKVALVAFVVLQLKELKDAGRFDTLGTAVDGGLIGAGTLILDAVMSALRRGRGAHESPSASTS
jgi:predicted CDP-diglyceride synthetase/phosphatidate cytidylyltransferase